MVFPRTFWAWYQRNIIFLDMYHGSAMVYYFITVLSILFHKCIESNTVRSAVLNISICAIQI